MKSLIATAGIFLMLLAAHSALAQERPHDRRSGPAGPAGPAPKSIPAQQVSAQSPEGPRGGRMTSEERQQLRRDVNNHGREIYRDRGSKRSQ